jgi:3-hydroxyacyl-CoA dehydrogenase
VSEVSKNGPVRFEREGDVGLIVIDSPPLNAGSSEVRRGLLAAIRQLQAAEGVVAGVLIGAGAHFMAGSDIREFSAPLAEPHLPQVIAALEACPRPVVAAIKGAALGGGYELSLGCDRRIGAADAIVGLPETTLGIIPGAGGTQRLPRMVGQAKAIELICAGTRVKAGDAAKLGMIDAVAEGDLRSEAVALARTLKGKSRVIERPVPPEDAAAIEAAAVAALKAGRSRPHIKAAIDAIRLVATVPPAEGLAKERAVFQELRVGREAAALRHLFFAERDAAKVPGLAGVEPRAVAKVAVIGGGTMGSGIAIASLDSGYSVTLIEMNEEAAQKAFERIKGSYAKRVESGRISAGDMEKRLGKLSCVGEFDAASQADLVVEAVFEEIGVKQDVFRKLGAVARPDAVLATNTSYLSIGDIANAAAKPENVVGLHFFSPAEIMKLVEVIRHPKASPVALATALAFARKLRKMPIVANDAFGFVGNRIYAAYRRQVEFMLEEGAFPDEIDAALEAFGFAMGPFAVADLSGLDIAWRMRQATASKRDPKARYVKIADRLCEMGRLGRKTGAGYYRYDPGARRGMLDDVVRNIVVEASAEAGRTRRPFTAGEIVERVMASMASEAALLLAEGVATQASDVDLALVNGYGFPRHEGGPVFWARMQPKEKLAASFAGLAETGGHGFRVGDPAVLLADDTPA